MKRKVKWCLLLGWMIVIFLFSHKTGQQSSESSGLVEKLFSIFPFLPDQILGVELHFLIRKAAHFTEYFILYLLMFSVFIDYAVLRRVLLYTLFGVFLYACTDEWHQLFVPGRVGSFKDVCIDTAGGTLAMGLILLSYYIQIKHKRA